MRLPGSLYSHFLETNIVGTKYCSQLRDLEKDGVVHRKVYPEVPPKVEYMLTKDGAALRPALKVLKSWAESRKVPS